MFSLVLCFTLDFFFVVSFTLPTIIHSQCFQTILSGIVLLTWGPWFPGSNAHSFVLRGLHAGHPHRLAGPVIWVFQSRALADKSTGVMGRGVVMFGPPCP